MSKNYYKGFRRLKVKPAGERARWWWVRIINENDRFIMCERVNKYGSPVDVKEDEQHIQMISRGAVMVSKEAVEDFKYGELVEAG